MMQKVLLVDDEPDTLKMYSDLLGTEGYEVVTATNGNEVLSRINGWRPDLILLDIMLPGRGGIDVARDLAHRPETSNIPIVIITALSTFPSFSDIEGIRRFIYKPCRPKTLLEGIRDVLHHHHR